MKIMCSRILRLFLCFSFVVCGCYFSIAQQRDPEASEIGITTADAALNPVMIDNFEDMSFWRGFMPEDQGYIRIMRTTARPDMKIANQAEQTIGLVEEDIYALGARISYLRRGYNRFAIEAVRPIPVPGITKTISVWVAGRNYEHVLKFHFLDYFGAKQTLTVGKLNFVGWKKMTVAVPPSIPQSDFHFFERNGIRFTGISVETDPLDAYGTYYVYFDGLEAVSDLFVEKVRDEDDPTDGW